MAGRDRIEWPDDELLAAIIREQGSISAAARHLGVNRATLQSRVNARGLNDRVRTLKAVEPAPEPEAPELDAQVHDLIRRKKRVSVEAIADQLDVAPRHVRDTLDRLREKGYRVPDETGGIVELQTVVPDKVNLHKSVLDGDRLTIGIVSDTHLSSNEEALAELELAYDVFGERGIREVFHAGDFTCGAGIFRTQASEIRNHTFETQVDYLVRHYPRRDGIVTRGITGNHDIEGDFGRIGANPVAALAHQRDDVEFLGDYSAWVELPNGAWLHLLHGKGGMSYAYSYKAQKLVDGYPAGRKPAILVPGHWHVSGWIEQRGVQVVWPGCFEWRSKFLERLGLSPSVGFWIFDLTLGDDGSLVRFRPEWHRFYEGRHVAQAA